MFNAIAGPDNGDPNAAPVPLRQPVDSMLRQLRIGYFEDNGRTPVTKETRAAVQHAAQVLRDDGFTVESFRPEGLELALQLWHVLFIDGVSFLLRQGYKDRESEMYEIVREIIARSEKDPPLTIDRLLDTLFSRDVVRSRFLEQMDRYPILLCPVSAARHFDTASVPGTSRRRRWITWITSVIRSASTFWEILLPSSRWGLRLRVYLSAFKSSDVPGKRNAFLR